MRRTPAREAAQNIVKDILNNVSGVNDSGLSGFEEFNGNKIRQFDDTDNQDSLFNEKTEKPLQQQQQQPTESEVLGGQEFDDFLDNKYRETNKNAETDWSDDD